MSTMTTTTGLMNRVANAVTVYASFSGESISAIELLDDNGHTLYQSYVDLDGLEDLDRRLQEQMGLTLTDTATGTFDDGLVLSVAALGSESTEVITYQPSEGSRYQTTADVVDQIKAAEAAIEGQVVLTIDGKVVGVSIHSNLVEACEIEEVLIRAGELADIVGAYTSEVDSEFTEEMAYTALAEALERQASESF